jgi:catechol 2,3-dioxygenase-like lactoylglutathione lyase family enzyme
MNGKLTKAYGYQGDNMKLPVADLAAALPFYENVLGFRVVSRADMPNKSAVLARDLVQIGFVESGADSSQDGCAFHVDNVDALRDEFQSRLPEKQLSAIDVEDRGDDRWRVFYVVAPDGLCYWFGARA